VHVGLSSTQLHEKGVLVARLSVGAIKANSVVLNEGATTPRTEQS
jgi:hypothetical protein